MAVDRNRPFFQRMDRFLYSPAYLLFLGALTVLSNVFCLEVFVYPVLILTGIYICLFGRDLLPIFPIFACGYISPSGGNNPGVNGESIFSLSGGGIYLAIMLTLLAGCLVYRLVTDPVFGGKKFLQKGRRLLPGMVVLGITYAISGLCSGQWEDHGWQNLLFAFLQFVAIAGLYYLLSGAVLWDCAPKAYLFWTGLCVGYVLLLELIGVYFTTNVIVDGIIFRSRIVTGWGHYNSMGAMFAMMIPLCFFLTGKGKYAWFAYVSAFLFCLGLLFTCSRASIIFGAIVYVVAYILSFCRNPHARSLVWIHILLIAGPVVVFLLFREELLWMFGDLFRAGFHSPAIRINTYIEGLKQFVRFPVFGGSFFPVDADIYVWATQSGFTDLFPARWHNTLVQLLATGGVTCLAGYILHRVQTVKLFVKDISNGKVFAGLSVAALLLMSLADCHFFNVGPVLLYSGILAFVEFGMQKYDKLG